MRGLMCVVLFGTILSAGVAVGQIRKERRVAAAQPVPVEKVGDGKLRERILLAVVRSRVVDTLVNDGIGERKFKDRAEAGAFYDQLDHETVLGAVKEAAPKTWAAVGEGGPLARLIQWIKDHPEEVAAIIKLILSLLALL